MSECPICLEPISPTALLGRIQGCLHAYHEQCLMQWSTHSNSCPTCRILFYAIDIVDQTLPHFVKRKVTVKDKIIENDAIDNIPSEFIIPAQVYPEARVEDPERSHDGVCMICSSAHYSRRSKPMVSCVGCGAKFHTLCLGHQDEPEWFCPVCECCQEIAVRPAPRTSSRSINRTRQGLTIFNENDEIEDFDDRDKLIRASLVLNGGVLLRREARQKESLTVEEADSWNALEMVRHGTVSHINRVASQDPVSMRKRRRRPITSCASDSSLDSVPALVAPTSTSHKSSRFVSLMEQIKTGSSSASLSRHPGSRNEDIEQDQPKEKAKGLASAAKISADAARPLLSQEDGVTQLTYDQKSKIQQYVRQILRPYYNPLTGSSNQATIKTESEFIKINKTISRKVYSEVLSLYKGKNPSAMERLFTEKESKLKDLVDLHAEMIYRGPQ